MKVAKFLLVAGVLGLSQSVATAQMYMTDMNGQVLRENKYVDTQGSPYFDEAWKPGAILMKPAKNYTNAPIRFDAYGGELEYQQKGKAYRLAPSQVQEFKMLNGSDTLRFRNGFAAANGNSAETYYQVLYDGSVKLLKQLRVTQQETKPYSSATTVKNFARQELYFVSKSDGSLQRIQRNRKSILAAFPEKKEGLEKAMKEFDVNDDAGLLNVIATADGSGK